MAIKTVGVIGCGLMGAGITQVCAQSGYKAIVCDTTTVQINGGISRIDGILSRNVSKGRLKENEKSVILGRITGTTNFEDLSSCELVIEAVTENLNTKQEIFRTVDKIVRPEALLASNTSSISITELASVTDRPQQVLGLHFFNPVPVMRLIEMVIANTHLGLSNCSISLGSIQHCTLRKCYTKPSEQIDMQPHPFYAKWL